MLQFLLFVYDNMKVMHRITDDIPVQWLDVIYVYTHTHRWCDIYITAQPVNIFFWHIYK